MKTNTMQCRTHQKYYFKIINTLYKIKRIYIKTKIFLQKLNTKQNILKEKTSIQKRPKKLMT